MATSMLDHWNGKIFIYCHAFLLDIETKIDYSKQLQDYENSTTSSLSRHFSSQHFCLKSLNANKKHRNGYALSVLKAICFFFIQISMSPSSSFNRKKVQEIAPTNFQLTSRCDICDRSFQRNGGLRIHLNKSHKQDNENSKHETSSIPRKDSESGKNSWASQKQHF